MHGETTSAPFASAERTSSATFARFLFELGQTRATGVLAVAAIGARESFSLRDGAVLTSERDPLGRRARARLTCLATSANPTPSFTPGTIPSPGDQGRWGRPLPLDTWAREHLEGELTMGLSQAIARDLDGALLAIRPGSARHRGTTLDETDRLLLAALAEPRDLAALAISARVPRFRLLAFVHFLSSVGQLVVIRRMKPSSIPPQSTKASEPSEPFIPKPPRVAFSAKTSALRLLGLPPDADRALVKGAYRRLARALHPDLHPGVNEARRRDLERRLAHVNAAYFELTTS